MIRPECAGSKQPALLQEESGHRRAQCHHSGLSADEQVLQRHGSAKHSRILAVVRRELQPKTENHLDEPSSSKNQERDGGSYFLPSCSHPVKLARDALSILLFFSIHG